LTESALRSGRVSLVWLVTPVVAVSSGAKALEVLLHEASIIAAKERVEMKTIRSGSLTDRGIPNTSLDSSKCAEIVDDIMLEYVGVRQSKSIPARSWARGRARFLNGFACTTTPRANRGEFVELRAPKDDTKFIWIFMLSKTFRNLQWAQKSHRFMSAGTLTAQQRKRLAIKRGPGNYLGGLPSLISKPTIKPNRAHSYWPSHRRRVQV
jgi:hypothetical protein